MSSSEKCGGGPAKCRGGPAKCKGGPVKCRVAHSSVGVQTSSSISLASFTCHLPKHHLTLTLPSPDHQTIIWPLPNPNPYLNLNVGLGQFDLHLTFTWSHLTFTWSSPDNLSIIWRFPDHYLTIISSFQLKKLYGEWPSRLYAWPSRLYGGSTHNRPYLRV